MLGGFVLLLLVVGCGPASGGTTVGAENGASSNGADTNAATDASGAAASSSSAADEAADSSVKLDYGGSGLPQPGEPPDSCELPERPNANVTGTTSLGEVAMTAAVFAEDGGGKCPQAYRVVLASDPFALAEEVERYGASQPRMDVIELALVLPYGPPVPGAWEASLRQIRDGDEWRPDELTANVTSVTTFDDADAHVEVTFRASANEFAIEGTLRASYCFTAHGITCGA